MKSWLHFSLILLTLCVLITGSGNPSIPNTIHPKPSTYQNVALYGNTTTNTTEPPSNQTGRPQRPPYCPRQRSSINTLHFVFILILAPVTIIGNGVVCYVILSTVTLRRQPMYLLLTSLAVADLLIGCIQFPIQANVEWNGGCFDVSVATCSYLLVQEVTLSVTSVVHLFAVGMDRCLALKYTYQYGSIMTKGATRALITSIWAFSLFWALLNLFRWDDPSKPSISNNKVFGPGCFPMNKLYYKVTYYVVFLIPLVVMVAMYSFIYSIAIHHVNEISKLEVRDSSVATENARKEKQMKLIRSLVVVVFAFFICWIPSVVQTLLFYDHPELIRPHFRSGATWFKVVNFISTFLLPRLSSSLNPFIYVVTNKAFTSAFYGLLTKHTGIKLQKGDNKAHNMLSDKTTTSMVEMTPTITRRSNDNECGIVNQLTESRVDE